MLHTLRVFTFLGFLGISAGAARAEDDIVVAKALLPGTLPVASAVAPEEHVSCSPADLQAAKELTFTQRACFYRARLLSKSYPFRAAVFSAYREFQSPAVKDPGFEGFARGFGTYYARRTAQSAGEFLAGYLNHEDPRFQPSLEHGFWKRSRSALLGVMVTRDQNGGSRMAFAPVAGAFGSGMASVAWYGTGNSVEDGLRRSGISYGLYFGTALLREFRPELSGMVSRLVHWHK